MPCPRIEHERAGTAEVLDVSGGDADLVHERRGRDQGVWQRIGIIRFLALPYEASPGQQYGLIDIENPIAEPYSHAVAQPSFQISAKARIGNLFDSEPSFRGRHTAEIAGG